MSKNTVFQTEHFLLFCVVVFLSGLYGLNFEKISIREEYCIFLEKFVLSIKTSRICAYLERVDIVYLFTKGFQKRYEK